MTLAWTTVGVMEMEKNEDIWEVKWTRLIKVRYVTWGRRGVLDNS